MRTVPSVVRVSFLPGPTSIRTRALRIQRHVAFRPRKWPYISALIESLILSPATILMLKISSLSSEYFSLRKTLISLKLLVIVFFLFLSFRLLPKLFSSLFLFLFFWPHPLFSSLCLGSSTFFAFHLFFSSSKNAYWKLQGVGLFKFEVLLWGLERRTVGAYPNVGALSG